MGIEHCYECDEATGNAGIGDGSLEFEGEVYCDDCYVDTIIEVATERDAENERLKKLLNVSCCHSHGDVAAPKGVCEWCDAVREVFKLEASDD